MVKEWHVMHRRVGMYPGVCVHIGVDVVAAVLAGDVGELAVSTSGGRHDVCGDLHMPPNVPISDIMSS
ncbi:hypothetical protein MMEU_1171 [Mycobacterium marinum str. Europe]|nr:hypothetical protein MMEU_1171 [Mycobacterium marinum str. Europe]